MRRIVPWVLALSACDTGPGGGDYPILPGGGPGTVHPTADAAVPGADGALDDAMATIAGRVCVLADLRLLTACAASGAGGLRVRLGTSETTTADDGTFALFAPTETSLIWRVSGPDLMTSVMPRGADAQIPAITATRYAELAGSNGVIVLEQEGAIVLQVTQQGAPLAGAVVTASPAPTYGPFYDGASATQWDQDATGVQGVSWWAGAAIGTVGLAVTPPSGAEAFTSVPVEEASITFATLELP